MTGSAYIYLRVSTAEQVENFSLDSQEEACRAFCEREGLDVARVFREEGESAKTRHRPRLDEMLNACGTHARRDGITSVVVYKVDRLSRQVEDYAAINALLHRVGVRVRSASESFDDSPAGRFTENLMAAVAQFDNDVRSERTKAGMRHAAMSGRWQWQAPLGYKKGPRGAEPSLTLDPETSPLIRHAFQIIATRRFSKVEALHEVSELGLRSVRGNLLTPQTLGSMLRNRLYIGRVVVPKWDIDVEGDFEPLIEPALFDTVQDVVGGRSPSKVSRIRNHPDFPLRRIVRCGHCESPFTGSWSKGRSKTYAYYRCPRKGCSGSSVRKDALEGQAADLLAKMSLQPTALHLLDQVVREAWEERQEVSITAAKQLEEELRSVTQKQNRLMDKYLEGSGIDEETFERQSTRLRQDEAALRNRYRATIPDEANLARCIDTAQMMLSDLESCWNHLEPQHRADFLGAVYPSGLTYRDGIIGTAENPWWLNGLQPSKTENEDLAPPTGFEPVLPA